MLSQMMVLVSASTVIYVVADRNRKNGDGRARTGDVQLGWH